MEYLKKLNLLVIIGFFIYAILASCYIIGNLSLASTFISICYLWIIFVCHSIFFKNQIKKNDKDIILVLSVLCFGNVFLNNIMNCGIINFSYFKKVIMFLSSIVWITFCKYNKLKIREYYCILVFCCIVSLLSIFYLNNGISMGESKKFLQYGFTNSNQAGMMLSACALFMLSSLFVNIVFWKKCLVVLLSLVIVYITYLTGCRSAILAIFFPFLLMVIDKIFRINIFGKRVLFVYSCFPLIFIVLYFKFVNILSFDMNLGYDAGKSNDSRLYVWQKSLEKVNGNEILGNYFEASHGTGEFQALNTHLDVLLSYGFIPLILFIFVIYKTLIFKKISGCTPIQKYGIYSFMASFIIGCFEAGLVAGSAGLFIAAFGLLLLSNIELE